MTHRDLDPGMTDSVPAPGVALAPVMAGDGRGAQLALPAPELERAYTYADAAMAPSTRRAYASDVRTFSAWCRARGLPSCPAAPETVAVYLGAEADAGAKPSTLARKVAAIRFAHVAAGLEPPTASEAVRRVLKGIRRAKGTKQAKKAPATAERVLVMVSHAPRTLAGLRDRALLLLGFGGAFRRSELAALTVADLDESPEGLRVTVRQSKTDQEGAGAVVPIARGATACPVTAVREWLTAAGVSEGPVFRAVDRHGRVSPRPLVPETVGRIVQAYAARAGYDAATFGGHSLRAGFLTSAAERGKALDRMMAVSRHKRVDTVLGYVRRAEEFKDHAGEGLL